MKISKGRTVCRVGKESEGEMSCGRATKGLRDGGREGCERVWGGLEVKGIGKERKRIEEVVMRRRREKEVRWGEGRGKKYMAV